jgi:hypothetical protein
MIVEPFGLGDDPADYLLGRYAEVLGVDQARLADVDYVRHAHHERMRYLQADTLARATDNREAATLLSTAYNGLRRYLTQLQLQPCDTPSTMPPADIVPSPLETDPEGLSRCRTRLNALPSC